MIMRNQLENAVILKRGEMHELIIAINNMIRKGPEYGGPEKWEPIKAKLNAAINEIDGEV